MHDCVVSTFTNVPYSNHAMMMSSIQLDGMVDVGINSDSDLLHCPDQMTSSHILRSAQLEITLSAPSAVLLPHSQISPKTPGSDLDSDDSEIDN
jgi:hypothetical protein